MNTLVAIVAIGGRPKRFQRDNLSPLPIPKQNRDWFPTEPAPVLLQLGQGGAGLNIEAANPNVGLPEILRIWIFVDYWNFQLHLGHDFKADWIKLGSWLAEKAADTAGIPNSGYSYEGMSVYSSYDPRGNPAHYRWATGWLSRQSKIAVQCLERQPRRPARCSFCNFVAAACPQCGQPMSGMQEKGVDTLLAMDMIRLAWEETYDLAVLVTNDGDLAPCVQLLGQKSKWVIHGRFLPWGTAVAEASFASFDIGDCREEIRMAGT